MIHRTVEDHAEDIEAMRVRGAGALARHATRALAAWARDATPGPNLEDELAEQVARLRATRPTAVSLGNALDFVLRRARDDPGNPAAVVEAVEVFDARSLGALEELGKAGWRLVPPGGTVLTHCNSQAVLSCLREARARGVGFRVVATETRPWRQGLVTVRQLAEARIPATLVVDSAVWSVLPDVDVVLVGCDAIARNGDVVNKVGTAPVALQARERDVPLHVCGETYKVALDRATGKDVPIEEREAGEVASVGEIPPDVEVRNPVFDVTPHGWIRSIVTELGAATPGEVARLAAARWG